MNRAPDPEQTALYEIFFCIGKARCTPFTDSNNKKRVCEFRVKWAITEEDLHRIHIFAQGGHGPSFRIEPTTLLVAHSVR